jgi:hypothetical protein
MIALVSMNFASNSSTAAANVATQSSTGGVTLNSIAIVTPKSDVGETDLVPGGNGTPGNNQAQNKQFNVFVVKLTLSPDEAQQLH